MNAAHALIYKQASGELDLEILERKNLLTKEERVSLDQVSGSFSNLAAIIYHWCIASLKDMLAQSQLSSPTVFSPILSCINVCFFATQDIFAFLDTQMPFSYLHLLTVITKIHMAFVLFYSAGVVSQGISTASWTRIVLGYAVLFTNNVIYEGLLLIHDMLVNPLGNQSGDFPKEVFVQQTAQLCDIMYNGGQGKGPIQVIANE